MVALAAFLGAIAVVGYEQKGERESFQTRMQSKPCDVCVVKNQKKSSEGSGTSEEGGWAAFLILRLRNRDMPGHLGNCAKEGFRESQLRKTSLIFGYMFRFLH